MNALRNAHRIIRNAYGMLGISWAIVIALLLACVHVQQRARRITDSWIEHRRALVECRQSEAVFVERLLQEREREMERETARPAEWRLLEGAAEEDGDGP